MGYVWPTDEEVIGKDKDYFRHKEHLHLINKGDEVIVVFTCVHPGRLPEEQGIR